MKIYPIPMVPGPVLVAQKVLDAYQTNYGSADLELEFVELNNQAETNLKITEYHRERRRSLSMLSE